MNEEFWDNYMRLDNKTAEDKKEILMQLDFNEFIDPNRRAEFYEYLNRVFSNYTNFIKLKIIKSYKQGQHMGRLNTLTNAQRAMVKQASQSQYAEAVDSTDGPNSGDTYGFEESFQEVKEEDLVENQ